MKIFVYMFLLVRDWYVMEIHTFRAANFNLLHNLFKTKVLSTSCK